jgi:hypothetical protein
MENLATFFKIRMGATRIWLRVVREIEIDERKERERQRQRKRKR